MAQQILTLLSLLSAVILFYPWLLLLLAGATIPVFLGETRFAMLNYSKLLCDRDVERLYSEPTVQPHLKNVPALLQSRNDFLHVKTVVLVSQGSSRIKIKCQSTYNCDKTPTVVPLTVILDSEMRSAMFREDMIRLTTSASPPRPSLEIGERLTVLRLWSSAVNVYRSVLC